MSPLPPAEATRATPPRLDWRLLDPYLEHRLRLPGGHVCTLRPARAQDEPLAQAFGRRLSHRARRLRFDGRAPVLAEPTLARFVSDGGRHLALLALVQQPDGEQLVGEARLVVDPDGRNAEFVLSVADPLRRCGLGRQLMLALTHAAGLQGVQWLRGETGDDNAAMLSLMFGLGFMPVRHDEANGAVVYERRIGPARP
jgi:acetyltransferase